MKGCHGLKGNVNNTLCEQQRTSSPRGCVDCHGDELLWLEEQPFIFCIEVCLYHKTCISIYRAHIFNVPGACAREGAARAATTKKQANAFQNNSVFMFASKNHLNVIFLKELMDHTCYMDTIQGGKRHRLHLCRRLVNWSTSPSRVDSGLANQVVVQGHVQQSSKNRILFVSLNTI